MYIYIYMIIMLWILNYTMLCVNCNLIKLKNRACVFCQIKTNTKYKKRRKRPSVALTIFTGGKQGKRKLEFQGGLGFLNPDCEEDRGPGEEVNSKGRESCQ